MPNDRADDPASGATPPAGGAADHAHRDAAVPPQRLVRGGAVTVATVLAVVTALGFTLFGLGSPDHAVAGHDASAWLWSTVKGEMARVNGLTGRVDTRMQVAGAAGHTVQVSQNDRFLLLRDLNTGKVTTFDLATLQSTTTLETPTGLGVTIAMHADAAFIVDTVQGIVRQLDPRTLTPVGEPVRYPPGITGGAFDGDGRLWVAVPTEGTVSAVTPAPLEQAPPTAGGAGGGPSPQLVTTVPVAEPSHDLAVSALDDGVAVLNRTTGTLTLLRGDGREADARREVALRLPGLGALPSRTSGSAVPVTVTDERRVYVVTPDGVRSFAVPGRGDRLRPAVAWAGRFYATDDAAAAVYVLDERGALLDTIAVPGANGPLELEVRENHLFINAPNSATARVVDDRHRVRVVDKYANDVLGGDPPPAPPPPPPPPKRPTAAPPGPPGAVVATAGNAQARVSWRPAAANGAPILRYVVQGAGRTFQVGADQRGLLVTGLTNGETYAFAVHAVNAKGAGPARTSNRVMPTAEVPDPPARVSATAKPDGTVELRWPAADGQGRSIARYAVSVISEGVTATLGEAAETALTVKDGQLEYGRQYAFSVVAVNDRGAASKPSPVSETVVPFTVPGPVAGLSAGTVADQRGAIRVQWQPAADHGRPVTGYQVRAAGAAREVTDTSVVLTGLPDGTPVTVEVTAVNEAGAGPGSTDVAAPVAVPVVNVSTKAATTTAITVRASLSSGAEGATCVLSVGSKRSPSVACGAAMTVGGLYPGTSHAFTVTATNVAGRGTRAGTQLTTALFGRAHCTTTSDSAEHRAWCSDPDNALELQRDPTRLHSQQVGRTTHGERYEAVCRYDTGVEVYAYIYNNERRSRIWVKIKAQGGEYYTPWAWFNLDGGAHPSVLRPC